MAAPKTPKIHPKVFVDESKPWRKRIPFDLVARGVAGVEEMQEHVKDDEIYFALIQIKIGSGSFERSKNIFVHFNGEQFPKPLLRSKLNKQMPTAEALLSPFHAKLILQSKKECTIDFVFSKLKGLFTEDNIKKGQTKFEIGSLKDEYKKRMQEARKLAKEEEERLAKIKERLRQKAEEEKRKIEEERKRIEEEERKKKEEEERKAREEEEKRLEEERKKKEEEELKKIQEEKALQKKKEEEEEKEKKLKEEEKKKKKKKVKKKKKKKDDWSDKRPWTGKRVVKCLHEETSPMNWAVFKPSDKEIIPMKFGHGDLNDLRDALLDDQVQYGLMRLSFGEGRFRRSHWVMIIWSPDKMTQNVPQKLRKKRMDSRFRHVGYRGNMQKLIGPYNVDVLAEEREQVTLEDWILRVRKTVVVDGKDDFINAESFRKALESEKKKFDELKRKREEEEAKRKAEEEESSSDEPIPEKKKKKKKKKKRKKSDDDTDVTDAVGDEENENDEDDDDKVNEENQETEEQKKERLEREEKEEKEKQEKLKKEQEEKLNKLRIEKEAEEAKKKEELEKERKEAAKRKKLEDMDLAAEECYECVILMKNPETNLTWVLLKPKIPTKK